LFVSGWRVAHDLAALRRPLGSSLTAVGVAVVARARCCSAPLRSVPLG
jgi:hypothetical protein